MPVYLSSQHFSALNGYVLAFCVVVILGLALYADYVKGQGE